MTDTVTGSITKTTNAGASMILKFAPPLIGLAVGYIIGDVMDISSYLMGAVQTQGARKGASGMSYAGTHYVDAVKFIKLITAGIYGLIGIAIWNWLDGKILGGLIGGFFIGVAVRGLVGVIKPHA